MKKILGLTVALIAVIAMLGTGTWAYFNDVVVVEDNTISAGKLYLDDTTKSPISLTSINPGTSETVYAGDDWPILIKNMGDMAGKITITIDGMVNLENVRQAIETKSGDLTSDAASGELGDKVEVAFWLDSVGGDGAYTAGEKSLTTTGDGAGTDYSILALQWGKLDAFSGDSYLFENIAAATALGQLNMIYRFTDNTTAFWLAKVNITAGGSGYEVDDTITLANGAVLTVEAVDTAGAVKNVTVTNSALYDAVGDVVISTTNGVGEDATFSFAKGYNTDNVAQTDSVLFDLTLDLVKQ